jgi:cellulose synthase/poly-beta-1,6-N-acetylglucosamine synthase-like glycosyltransferase
MPVFNEGDFIQTSLIALTRQTYPVDRVEIIVADGMSNDDTRSKIDEIARSSQIKIAVVDNPKKIAPCGLNRAIQASKGDVIIRIDGHCEVDENYIEMCVKHLLTGAADGVGGPIETIGSGKVAEAIAIAMSSNFGVGGSAFRTVKDKAMYTDSVAFPGYTRQTLEKAGPFNEELIRNQDDEYNFRIRKLGGKILLTPEIRSRYYSRSSLRSLWRQYFQYGYWKVRVLQLHPRQMRLRQFVPFAFVTALLALLVFASIGHLGSLALLAFLALYASVNLFSSIQAVRSREFSLFPLVSTSFLILHLSYGLGFFVGLVVFSGRWHLRQKSYGSV